MKMRVDVEMTPEELRRFLGLPDLSELQAEWLSRYQEQAAGAELGNVDPATFMKPLMANNAAAMEAFNRAFWNAFAGAGGTPPASDSSEDADKS